MDDKLNPIRIDMTIGDESSRIVKVKHQSFEETVRVLNRVLEKMNAPGELELVYKEPVKAGVASNDS